MHPAGGCDNPEHRSRALVGPVDREDILTAVWAPARTRWRALGVPCEEEVARRYARAAVAELIVWGIGFVVSVVALDAAESWSVMTAVASGLLLYFVALVVRLSTLR